MRRDPLVFWLAGLCSVLLLIVFALLGYVTWLFPRAVSVQPPPPSAAQVAPAFRAPQAPTQTAPQVAAPPTTTTAEPAPVYPPGSPAAPDIRYGPAPVPPR